MDISSGGILIVVLNKKDAKKLDLHSGDRVIIHDGGAKITCVLDISHSEKAVPDGTVGLFEEVLTALKVKNNNIVNLHITDKPESVIHIRDKLYGKKLSYTDLYHIIDDITHDRLTDIEKTYFVAAGFSNGFTMDEVVDMTKAMVKTGNMLKFPGVTLDKHSIGGVPGNRTTMIVVPIIAAAGFTIPKTSSRAITSPAGTADTMECLAQVELTEKKILQIVRKVGGCMVHGGAMNLAPADDKIIKVEHPLSIDAEGQLLASVMAKKYSVTANHVLIDIPMGKSTKVKTLKEANHLRRKFEEVGRRLKMNVKVVVTNGSQPIGNGVGPLLEAEDVMAVLKNDPLAPQDLKRKAVYLAGQLLEMTGKYKDGEKEALGLLESCAALEKMNQIIKAQSPVTKLELGHHHHPLKAGRSGKIVEIDNETIAKVARIAGAPEDKGAGLYLTKKVGDKVKRGDLLYTVYAENETKMGFVQEFLKGSKGNGYVVK